MYYCVRVHAQSVHMEHGIHTVPALRQVRDLHVVISVLVMFNLPMAGGDTKHVSIKSATLTLEQFHR